MAEITKDEIARFLTDELLEGRSVAHDEDLLLSGLLDSLGVVSLVAHIEERIGRRIPAGDIIIENFTSIDTIVAYLDGK